MLSSSPRPATEAEVWAEVRPERWQRYQAGGNSDSMMDHYYDKLLQVPVEVSTNTHYFILHSQIALFDPAVVQNSYLQGEAAKRVEPLVNTCLLAGKTGEVPLVLLKKHEEDLNLKGSS